MNGPHIMIFGNLTRDPVLRYTTNQGTPFVQVGVATNTYHGPDEPQETYFFDATLWRNHAESIARNCRKGQDVFFMGRYSQREYERRDGSTGIAYQVDVKEFRYFPRGQSELREGNKAALADEGDEADLADEGDEARNWDGPEGGDEDEDRGYGEENNDNDDGSPF